jgi:hygromycin-B 7''-O-kinase
MTTLPAQIDVQAFDALHDQPERWRDIVVSIAAEHSAAPARPVAAGTALVALVGTELVVKLFPPFLRDHFEFERELLDRLYGRLRLPTPRRVAGGELDGWPYHVMTQLPGRTLDTAWPELDESTKCALLHDIGRLAAEVHALPVGSMAALAPAWPDFLQRQRERCHHRQQRTGLPAQLLVQLEAFLAAGPVPAGPDVILTGEYTPFNLMSDGRRLTGMFDFGDGLVGPREYDWLGPLCFLAAGHAARIDALFAGYGLGFDRGRRDELLRLLLLHRYSCLPAQIAVPGWQDAPGFSALAARIWP